MPTIKPDLSKIVSDDPRVGTSPVGEITDVKDMVSKAGNPMIVVETEFEVDGVRYRSAGFHVYQGKGAYGFAELLRTVGFGEQADLIQKGQMPEFDTDQLLGSKVRVVVEERFDAASQQMKKGTKSYLPAN